MELTVQGRVRGRHKCGGRTLIRRLPVRRDKLEGLVVLFVLMSTQLRGNACDIGQPENWMSSSLLGCDLLPGCKT